MTAPSYALPVATYLEQVDNAAGEKARKILRSEAGSARHRSLLAAEVLTRHITSRRRAILAAAAEAEAHNAQQEVAS